MKKKIEQTTGWKYYGLPYSIGQTIINEESDASESVQQSRRLRLRWSVTWSLVKTELHLSELWIYCRLSSCYEFRCTTCCATSPQLIEVKFRLEVAALEHCRWLTVSGLPETAKFLASNWRKHRPAHLLHSFYVAGFVACTPDSSPGYPLWIHFVGAFRTTSDSNCT